MSTEDIKNGHCHDTYVLQAGDRFFIVLFFFCIILKHSEHFSQVKIVFGNKPKNKVGRYTGYRYFDDVKILIIYC